MNLELVPLRIRLVFRRHELRGLKMALRAPLLSLFAMFFVLLPWFVLAGSFGAILALFTPIFPGPAQDWTDKVMLVMLNSYAMISVILWALWMVPWYIMCVKLTFGEKGPAIEKQAWLENHILGLTNG